LMVVSNPTGNIAQLNLPFAEIEGSLVRSYFRADLAVQLDKVGATPAAVLAATGGKSCWHFSSHGFFNWEDAREAGLRMKDDAPLTVRQLLEADFVPRPRLVVLSACETGLFDVNRRPDEFVGLPTAFIQAGAAGVLSALWQVDDLATALLMAKFYDLRLRQNLAPTKALKDAQNWLRTASKAQLLEFGETAAAKSDLAPAKLAELVSALKSRPRSGTRGLFWAILSNIRQRFQSYPFAHPYYWGGFVYAGL
jgi:CHAT domain-containing protein